MSDEFCSECGAKITGKTGFCSECGAPINIEKISNNINEANIQNTIDLESKLNKIAIVGYVSSILSFIFFSKLLMFGKYTDLLSIPLAIIALGAAFYIISKSTKMRIHGVIILLILLALFGSQTIFSLYVYIAVIIIAAILLIRYFKNK